MNEQIGKCSHCGGRVTMPRSWSSVVPPVPTCERCGARAKDKSPTIEMEPLTYADTDNTFGSITQAVEAAIEIATPDVSTPDMPDFSGGGGDFGGGGASGDF